VRALGRSLGLAEDLVARQPFPGPGLAIRVMCAETPAFGDGFEHTNAMLRFLATGEAGVLQQEEIDRLKRAKEVHGCIAALGDFAATTLPVRTVGVQGDGRTYSYAVAVSCAAARPPWQALLDFAKLVPRLCHKVNRVVFAWGALAAGPIERITPTHLTLDVLDQLREADAVVNELLVKHDLVTKVAQVPVVSVPVDLDAAPGVVGDVTTNRSIVIRTFLTTDFMTGVPATPDKDVPEAVLDTMRERILAVDGITRVMYDLTAKPPGTTEWE
jgi:GMP synthase (glutamine-hydrolysing)